MPLTIYGSVVKMVSELKILGVILDIKLAFEKQVRAIIIVSSASRMASILRKTMSVFRDVGGVAKCLWSFILHVVGYCSPVWMSTATSHLLLLDSESGSVSCDLWHRCKICDLFVSCSKLTVWW